MVAVTVCRKLLSAVTQLTSLGTIIVLNRWFSCRACTLFLRHLTLGRAVSVPVSTFVSRLIFAMAKRRPKLRLNLFVLSFRRSSARGGEVVHRRTNRIQMVILLLQLVGPVS